MDNPQHGFPANPYNAHAWIINDPQIGAGTWIGPFTVIDGIGGLKIGKGCDISSGAHVLSHSTVRRCISERRYAEIDRAETVIEDFVFIGENATILMGVRVGHHSVIGAGAVVEEYTVIPPFSLVVGVPGRVVRSIEKEVRKLMGSTELERGAAVRTD